EFCFYFFYFFFQAEDGIRDLIVTGVQTCALPICSRASSIPSKDGIELARERVRDVLAWEQVRQMLKSREDVDAVRLAQLDINLRSEERRVGKECKSR